MTESQLSDGLEPPIGVGDEAVEVVMPRVTLITDDSAESLTVRSSFDDLGISYAHVHESGLREDRPTVFLPDGPGRRLYYGAVVITGVFLPRMASYLNGRHHGEENGNSPEP